MPETRNPWERQPGETGKQFEAFTVYRDLPYPERSLHGAYRAHTGRERPPGSWFDLAARNNWKERAEARDAEEDRQRLARIQRRRSIAIEEIADLGETLRKKAMAAARMLTAVSQKIGEREGKEVWIMEVEVSAANIARLAEVGVKLEQAALGIGGPAPQMNIDVEDLSDEELNRIADGEDVISVLADTRKGRAGATPAPGSG